EIKEVQVRIVSEGVPDGAATLVVGRSVRIPGLVSDGQRRVLIRLSGGAGYREEAPFEFAGLDVIGGDVAAHATLIHVGAAVADDGEVAGHVYGTCAGIGLCVVNDGVGIPNLFAGLGIDRMQVAVD